ncbi:MAG TPA: hypothetical protein VJ793_26850 [Anaerolineae bacterium]|nr:hypothetical protein [Pyrinomonadaceae bacterium]HKZ87261.1 hypothetical protein [Anaerolineae bacterium]
MSELRYHPRLLPLFDLLPYVAHGGTQGSVAFARDATLLNTALRERGAVCGCEAIFA